MIKMEVKTMTKYEKLIGKTYEDPDGVWEITNIVEENAELKCIQEGDDRFGDLFEVPIEEAILQLENLKEHCNEMSKSGKMWENDVIALNTAINFMKNDRNEMIVEDIKRIIKRYDEMNLNISFEERKENHIKAYMEIKDRINDCEEK